MTGYHEIPDAFPDDYRDLLPTLPRSCACGHDEDAHDGDGICQVRGCDCEEFRDARKERGQE